MEFSWIEIIGYLASIIIMLAMLMSSIVRLRWINLLGSALFSIYGFAIDAIPVGIVNGFIVFINIYYLTKIYTKKEYFKTLEIRRDNKYLLAFLDFHKRDIDKFFPNFEYKSGMNTFSFFILRNMAVSGIFLAREIAPEVLYIGLDFAIPEYRDLKVGKYVYKQNIELFKDQGYKILCTKSENKQFRKYLTKMGFSEELINEEKHLVKHL